MSKNPWSDKRVLITGACGTVGSELLAQVLRKDPREVVGIDNNESELFFLREKYADDPRVNQSLCDLRDCEQLSDRIRGMDVVLHTAAFKHVVLCEQSPRSAVETNIQGTQNVIDAATASGVERVIFTSSDKAVNPTNVMGTSKLMGERLMTAANSYRRDGGAVFASTRFGNVLGSRGSVIPIFKEQIADGGPITLTDPRMTRFIMTLEQAVGLVMDSVFLARGGEVFVTKMPVVSIEDLAYVMREELAPSHGHKAADIDVEVIGSKPGEKMYEELINEEETRRTVELPRYYAVLPAFKAVYQDIDYTYPGSNGQGVGGSYNSSNRDPMSREELRSYLLENELIKTESTTATV